MSAATPAIAEVGPSNLKPRNSTAASEPAMNIMQIATNMALIRRMRLTPNGASFPTDSRRLPPMSMRLRARATGKS